VRFRTRLVVVATGAVAVAVLLACGAAYFTSRDAVVGSVDDTLVNSAYSAAHQTPLDDQATPGEVFQLVAANGQLVIPGSPIQLPVSRDVVRVAVNQSGAFYTTVTVHGFSLRELVEPIPDGTIVRVGDDVGPLAIPAALQLATPLSGVNDQLSDLRWQLLLVAAAGVLVALLLGWLVGRTALVPLDELTGAVEEVAHTTDVSSRLDPGGPDELGRLRRAFNRLLAALERSREAQRQLVLDAAHELRTPLTSLRTNLEVTRRLEELDPAEREVLIADVLTQMDELTQLVGDLAELARGDHPPAETAPIRLDLLVDDAVGLAASHGRAREVRFELTAEECWVVGQRDRIARAVGNLLDNALKWSPDGGLVEVGCRGGRVTVRDHGPGIDEDDLPFVFDRFYRAPMARSLPGSGLGLAIVAQVAAAEGGTITAANVPSGGALFELHLPETPAPGAPPDPDD
jgi:two-component system sensor histidine kinase MprB